MIATLVLFPLATAALALVLPKPALRRALLPLTGLIHLGLTLATVAGTPPPTLYGWLAVDDLSRLFLLTTSVIFAVVAVYLASYLSREAVGTRPDALETQVFSNAPDAIFVACLLAFLSMMTLVTVSQHLGLLWVAVEGTTLASAPLIYFHRHHRSLEATWKYLLICSVGIALALLGTFFVAAAADPHGLGLDLTSLVQAAPHLDHRLLRGAFALIIVGYGTKMGLAPMHTWLPDAHSEAPSGVSALLSAALLNCAWLGILRLMGVLDAAGEHAFAAQMLIVFGLLSMTTGAFFIIGQADYKRMLAYSSVEHMGLIALGVGIGGAAADGAMLHVLNHAIAKALLFMIAGNVLAAYKTRHIPDVTGLMKRRPISAFLWLVGLFAIVGSPPFGLFFSEMMIVKGALSVSLPLAIAVLFLLAVVFLGLSSSAVRMVQGLPHGDTTRQPEPLMSVAPAALLGVLSLGLGLYLPNAVITLVTAAAGPFGGVGF